jgi:hypothetical protein
MCSSNNPNPQHCDRCAVVVILIHNTATDEEMASSVIASGSEVVPSRSEVIPPGSEVDPPIPSGSKVELYEAVVMDFGSAARSHVNVTDRSIALRVLDDAEVRGGSINGCPSLEIG